MTMIYALYGFVFGLLIPYLARRFAKFMPATFAYAIYRIILPNKTVSRDKRKDNPLYRKLMNRYLMRSLGWGIVTAALSYLVVDKFSEYNAFWSLAFVWILLLLTEIDNRMFLLPDILTLPLLLLGFAFAVMVGVWVDPLESAMGALAGYFLPVVASLLILWKNKDAFGGGDVKLLSALGAWLGVENLLYVIILSTLLFMVWALIKKQKSGAYGPAIAMAAIIVAFYVF